MARHRNLFLPLVLFSVIVVLVGCYGGPSVSGSFDRNYNVTGPTRIELTNASGDVDITASADGKVHVRGEVRASGFGFDNPQKRLDDTGAARYGSKCHRRVRRADHSRSARPDKGAGRLGVHPRRKNRTGRP